ncbi:nudix domain-containing protein [Diplodia corticola]|uniref:Nudix domain-containing protein n=1 Tax=Diplodia corticola TaxID=236234 RepID=A0A1J9S885_9PEZI|nr:nudix domain-containing protein [Diplodia corticola]OJD36719.1 nudix domain-containing protein [Diplodia corticola]
MAPSTPSTTSQSRNVSSSSSPPSPSSSSPPPPPPPPNKNPNKPSPAPPRPSSSILLLSPTNEVLLLHRVQTSSSFPSAHVFPGGNCEAFHDGELPDVGSEGRHADGPAYRWAGVRECFEESGILLVKDSGNGGGEGGGMVEEGVRERARKEVHGGTRRFGDVLAEWGVVGDVDNLIPFTRWITPTNAPKRFTTQMYLYLMPLAPETPPSSPTTTTTTTTTPTGAAPLPLPLPLTHEAVIPLPTPDGGVEHTAARFLPAHAWLDLARAGDIILFPPQFFLLHLVAQHVCSTPPSSPSPSPSSSSPSPSPSPSSPPQPRSLLQRQRDSLLSFVREGGWGEKCISPAVVGGGRRKSDGRVVLALDKPGWELEGSGREGVREYVVLVDFRREGPRRVEVGLRSEVLAEDRERERERVGEGKL